MGPSLAADWRFGSLVAGYVLGARGREARQLVRDAGDGQEGGGALKVQMDKQRSAEASARLGRHINLG